MKHLSILIPEEAVPASIVDPRYMFTAVNQFLEAQGEDPMFKVQLVGLSREVRLINGIFSVHTDALIDEVKHTDLILIPALSGDMIEWIKEKNGAWKFDYTIFDEYVQMAMDLGIDKAITLYTPVPWGNRFRYMDAATGNYVYETWSPGTDTYTARWHTFLTDFKAHLERKGWFKKTYLGINENELSQTLAAIKVMKAHSPEWRIT